MYNNNWILPNQNSKLTEVFDFLGQSFNSSVGTNDPKGESPPLYVRVEDECIAFFNIAEVFMIMVDTGTDLIMFFIGFLVFGE